MDEQIAGTGDEWSDPPGARLRFFVGHFFAILIDTGFLVLWVTVQWLSERLIQGLKLAEVIDSWVLWTFQIVLALSTLAPVVIYTYADVMVMWARARKKVRRAKHA